jgi:hypothetical protein
MYNSGSVSSGSVRKIGYTTRPLNRRVLREVWPYRLSIGGRPLLALLSSCAARSAGVRTEGAWALLPSFLRIPWVPLALCTL